MSTLAASLKKFERWAGRLNDDSSDVRREALSIVGQIAQAEGTLAERSLNTLALYISENRYGDESFDLFWALDVVCVLPPQLVLKCPKLLDAVLKAPLVSSSDAEVMARICLKIVESDELPRASTHLQAIIEKSKSALLTGGRRDFMKIVDWAEDNDVQMPVSSVSKAAEVKPTTRRLDPRPGVKKKQAAPVESGALLPRKGSITTPFVLNHGQIREKQAESETVSGYLAQIFNPDDPENAQALVAANSSVEGRVALRGLEPILFAFALRLASRATWKRADAESLAASLGLMFDGALEQLDDASLDEWGVLFAEGEDSIELNAIAITGLAKQS